jgi:cytosolic iron-sulfur protein assembly protein CIAO1
VRCVGWKDWGVSKRKRDGDGGGEGGKGVVLATGSFDANVGVWVHNAEYSARLNGGQDALTNDMTAEPPPNSIEIDDPTFSAPNDADEDDEEWHFSTLLTGPDSEIKSLSFSPPHYSANLLAMSSRDKSVWIWEEVEPDEWETIAVLQEHTGDVKCVAWNAGGRRRRRDGDEEDDTVIGGREILASGSYDDTIRLWRDVEEEGDWVCVGVLEGHTGTVWGVSWEKYVNEVLLGAGADPGRWEPRLASCSDDLSIRIWRRVLSEAERSRAEQSQPNGGPRLPSIIRPASSMERWEEDGALPAVHMRSVYAVDWSGRTGLVVSCGGDGVVAVYKEVLSEDADGDGDGDGDVVMNGTSESAVPGAGPARGKKTKWIVVAQIEDAHDEFEINHVCWALRRDPGKTSEGEEVIVSTGDDGVVKLWTLPDGLI